MPQTPGEAIVTVIALVFGLFIGAGLVINMLGLLFNREIDLGEFVVWLLAFVGVMATTIASVGRPIFPLLALVTILLGLIVPITSWAVDVWGTARMRREDLERLLQATEARPDIPYNFRKLGDLFYQRREFQLAIDYYEKAEALHHDVHQAFFLEKARERLRLGKGEPRICIRCGRMNPRLAFECMYCGAELPGGHQILAPLVRGRWRQMLVAEAALLMAAGLLLIILNRGTLGMLALIAGLGLAGLHFVFLKSGETVRLEPMPEAREGVETANAEGKAAGKANVGETDLPGETLKAEEPPAAKREIPDMDDMEDMWNDR